jgi:lysophospholipase L1-like esterase
VNNTAESNTIIHVEAIVQKTFVRILIVLALLCMSVSAFSAETAPGLVLKQGDRMVFLGDSITQQQIYTRYVMDYFALRYPDLKVTFRNAGWGGDRAPGGLARLERDVLSLKPNVVSICFGMNDAQYQKFDQAVYDTYIKAMTDLVATLKKAGVRVVLLTPGCVDPRDKEWLKGYNDTLGKFADGLMKLGHDEHLTVFNLHRLMLDVQDSAKAENPAFTMIPDGVHPSPPGHALMAFGLLSTLGCMGGASSVQIDAAKKTAATDRCKVDKLKVSDDAISFKRTDDALPTYLDADVASIVKYAPYLSTMNMYMFSVTGLKPGNWNLTVQGTPVGTFSADELARGVDLSGKPGPWKSLAEAVNGLSKRQEDAYFLKWRQSGQFKYEETKSEVEALKKKLEVVITNSEKACAKAVANRTWDWSLTLGK